MKVAEHFYSIQGEGPTAGFPAVFLRLSGCVLDCTWCDTVEVWKQGTRYTEAELLALFEKEGYINHINNGAHLVVTGGDPLIHQAELASFLVQLNRRVARLLFIEVETEGVLEPKELCSIVDQWNVSPKLSNSGMPLERRYKPATLRVHQSQTMARRTSFKFPVQSETDVREVEALIRTMNTDGIKVDPKQIWLMPIAANRTAYLSVAPVVAEFCKKNHWRFSPRHQLMLWDKATGV